MRADYEHHLFEEFRSGRLTRSDLLRRASVFGISASAVAALLAGTPAEASPHVATAKPRRGGTIRVGAVQPQGKVEPWTSFGGGAIVTYETAAECLCAPRNDYTLEPKLALSWKAGKTPKVWTFKLRENVLWHDGTPFTADDVVSTFNRITAPKSTATALAAFTGVLSPGGVEKVDSHTVRFHLKRAVTQFPYLVSSFTYGTQILPKQYKLGTFGKGGVGTGPFILRKIVPGRSATFVRNPHYWNPNQPYANGVVISFYADDASISLALQSGAIDIYHTVPLNGLPALQGKSDIQLLVNRSSRFDDFNMRVDQAPLNDKRVRQAVALCVDRPALIQGVLKGLGEIGNDHAFAPIYPDSALVNQIPQRKQDYARAQALLADAGYAKGISLTLSTDNGFSNSDLLVAMKAQCAPAGINITPDLQDGNVYYGAGANPPWLSLPFTLVEWGARGFAGQAAHPAFECQGVWNSSHWCNPEWTQTLNAIDAEVDEQKRRALTLTAAKIQQDETPSIIGYWYKDLRAIRKNVHGVPVGPANHLDLNRAWLG